MSITAMLILVMIVIVTTAKSVGGGDNVAGGGRSDDEGDCHAGIKHNVDDNAMITVRVIVLVMLTTKIMTHLPLRTFPNNN